MGLVPAMESGTQILEEHWQQDMADHTSTAQKQLRLSTSNVILQDMIDPTHPFLAVYQLMEGT
jgi:hypothetical protein